MGGWFKLTISKVLLVTTFYKGIMFFNAESLSSGNWGVLFASLGQ